MIFKESGILNFYKESSNKWYVDLPEWPGEKAALEMVAGADTMLDYMAEGANKVRMYFSLEPFDGCDKLEFIRLATDIGEGAYYKFKDFRGIEINLEMWLCDVTTFVFDGFPKILYVTSIND